MSVPTPYFVGGVPVLDLADRFGTPTFAFDVAAIRARFQEFSEYVHHRPLRVYYSVKAHPSVVLLRILRELGAGVDVCSPGDLAFAQTAGFAGEDVSYVGHAMSDAELRGVVASGAFFIADSIDQIRRIGALSPGRRIGIRLNVGVAHGFHPHVRFGARDSKFGIHDAQLPEVFDVARRSGVYIAGVHSHAGSDLLNPAHHLELLDALTELVLTHEPLHTSTTFVDIGGGWGTPFLPGDEAYSMETFGPEASARMARLARELGRDVELRVEPGAYLVMDAGVLLTRVMEIKRSVVIDGVATPTFVSTDTSYNHVHSAVAYGTYHPILIADRVDAPITDRYHIAGNLMQAGDVLAPDRSLPTIEVGDVLVIEKCGGYKACRAPTFNERPRPAEVYVDAGMACLGRTAETIADLLRDQQDESAHEFDDGVKWAETPFSSSLGRFRLTAYEFQDRSEHLALVVGHPAEVEQPLVRVQSSCLTGTALLAELCDCRQQLHMAMELVALEGAGCVLYLDQEGRSHGLLEKTAQLALINQGMDTVEAAEARGRGADLRTYEHAAWMLSRIVGHKPVRLLTNSPTKTDALRAAGVDISTTVPLEVAATAGNLEYLRVKRDRMGHILSLLPDGGDSLRT